MLCIGACFKSHAHQVFPRGPKRRKSRGSTQPTGLAGSDGWKVMDYFLRS